VLLLFWRSKYVVEVLAAGRGGGEPGTLNDRL
jgi:hypothetical protein